MTAFPPRRSAPKFVEIILKLVKSLAQREIEPHVGPSRRQVLLASVTLAGAPSSKAVAAGKPPDSFDVEALTSPEVRERIAAGATTLLVPIGGTEQNGPHMVLGKHNVRARWLAGEIAQRLGNALIAPVIAYVPEGSTHPPAGHMRFAGTISISDSAFEGILEGTARSFKQHGVRNVVLLGDHGSYQKTMERVATRLNHEWSGDPACRIKALTSYYDVTQTKFLASLEQRGFGDAELGTHAGLADTALAMAVDKALVRNDVLYSGTSFKVSDGVHGDPRRATAELGRIGTQQIIESSVTAIQKLVRDRV